MIKIKPPKLGGFHYIKNLVVFSGQLYIYTIFNFGLSMEVIYKQIRHGYAKITKEGILQLSIPHYLRNNIKFYNQLLEKGQKLLTRYQKKSQITTIDKDHIMLFGEQIPLEEVSSSPKKIPFILKNMLYEYAKPILDEYSKLLGIGYRMLKIRKTTSKWGSCTGHQIISLNTDLVHLPSKLIRYVIIHEACHLKIKNHSPKFRKLVEIHCPNYKILRKELRNLIIQ